MAGKFALILGNDNRDYIDFCVDNKVLGSPSYSGHISYLMERCAENLSELDKKVKEKIEGKNLPGNTPCITIKILDENKFNEITRQRNIEHAVVS